MSFTDSSLTQKLSVLPKHILVGYWHNWNASPAAFLPLRDVHPDFDVINIAFATMEDDGKILFAPHSLTSPAQFVTDVAALQRLGKKVLISIGGATGSTAIDSPAVQDNFCASAIAIVRQYGFDGIDLNLEGKVLLERGDADFRNPNSASIRHLIAAVREIRDHFGHEFILSLAPEIINVQGGFCTYEHASGSYLPVIHALRDLLTYVQVQHYNSGMWTARDHTAYAPGTADFHAAMAEMLLQGFPVGGDPDHFFPPLRPEQIVVGLAASPEAVNGGYTAPLEVEKALQYLASGYTALRGIMTWSINWDAANRHQFSNAIRAYLDALL